MGLDDSTHPDGFVEVYRAEVGDLHVLAADLPAPGGGRHRHHRVTLGEGRRGVVVVCREGGEVLLARSRRAAAGLELDEFPRGMLEPEDEEAVDPYAAAAGRELQEETGLAAASVEVVGEIVVDSAVYPLRVGVVVVQAAGRGLVSDPDGEVDGTSWIPLERFERMIAEGGVVDAITLSAWAVARAVAAR